MFRGCDPQGKNLIDPESEFITNLGTDLGQDVRDNLAIVSIFKDIKGPLILWAALRVVFSLAANYYSRTQIITQPQYQPFRNWFERTMLYPWLHWDAAWYMRIVSNGYQMTDGTAQFHPLYPWLAAVLSHFGLHPLFALILISSLSCIFLIIAFGKLSQLDFDNHEANKGLLILLAFPIAFIFFAPYSEALFILLSVLCIYSARRGLWWQAGIAGGLAALTRQQGIFLIVPVLWELWEASQKNLSLFFSGWKKILGTSLIPCGFFAWIVFRMIWLSDVRPDFSSLHKLIYSTLISPSARQVVPSQSFIWPWKALWLGLLKLTTDMDVDITVNFIFAFFFIFLIILSWPNQRTSYRLYTLITIIVSFSYYTGQTHPYMGLLRHLELAFPVFLGIGKAIKSRFTFWSLTIFGFLSQFFFLFLYITEVWVP